MDKIIEELKKVKDFRKNSGKRHPLWLVLLLVILGIMQRYVGSRAIGDFVKAHRQMISKNFHISPPIRPSTSTIRRVMMGVDWQNLSQIFNQWSSQLPGEYELLDWLAVDGKSLRSTVKNYHNESQNFVVMLSAYRPEDGLVLRMQRFENKKGSEIEQVRGLVKDLAVENKVFTLDALHCQKETTQTIIDSGNHYLITVKENQKKLYQRLEEEANSQAPLSLSIEEDKSHGRQIKREVSVFNYPDLPKDSWSGINSLIKVERQGKRGKEEYPNLAY